MPDSNQSRAGTPSRLEWGGLWKASSADRNVTRKEFEHRANQLADWLEVKYKISGTIKDCYVRGDMLSADRTQQIIVTNLDILTLEFLAYLQEWLRSGNRSWRI